MWTQDEREAEHNFGRRKTEEEDDKDERKDDNRKTRWVKRKKLLGHIGKKSRQKKHRAEGRQEGRQEGGRTRPNHLATSAQLVAAVGVVKIDKCSVCVIECPPQTPGSRRSPLRGAERGCGLRGAFLVDWDCLKCTVGAVPRWSRVGVKYLPTSL